MDWKDAYQEQRAVRDRQDTHSKSKADAPKELTARRPSPPKASYTPERIAAAIWLIVTGIQLVIWIIICGATRSLASPWWFELWTA